jgi:hypothetical protein
MHDFVIVRRNHALKLNWQIEDWVPGTRLGLSVEPDPASGAASARIALDASTDASGAGRFSMPMPMVGLFRYVLRVERPHGDETWTTVVRVIDQDLVVDATGASDAPGSPLHLSWELQDRLDVLIPGAS